MTCVKPFTVYSGKISDNGASGIKVPCGKCIQCRIQRTREWMIRIMHEYEIARKGVFITLTYDDEHYPEDGKVSKVELKNFIRRLKYELGEDEGNGIRYYAVGEYGTKTGRAHYHAIVIGLQIKLEDCDYHNGRWSSRLINRLWKNGNNTIGEISKESVQYVTGYVRKKLIGSSDNMHGQKSFAIYSRGLGRVFAIKNKDRIMSERGYTIEGRNVGIPRYYKKIYSEIDEGFIDQLRNKVKEKELKEIEKYGSLLDRDIAEIADMKRREMEAIAREKIADARAIF